MLQDEYRIRSYIPSDRAACLAVFDSNTPEFFAPHERDEFARFLDAPGATMLVLETTGAELVACGGYYVREETMEGGLAWGMVASRWHRHGIGRILLRSRLSALRTAGAGMVTVRTSQHSRGFFEREGFEEMRLVSDGFAPGIDMIELRLDLGFRKQGAFGMF